MKNEIKTISSETSYIRDEIAPNCDFNKISILKNLYIKSPRQRHRFCFHQDPIVDLHDIIICYDRYTYIPPNKHIGKSESLIILEGEIESSC
jgi:cupin fold WbuC family metalloprotein